MATGGGAVLDPENREVMTATGPIVWLQAHRPRSFWSGSARRTGSSPPRWRCRPAGRDSSGLAAERAGWYREAADHVIETSGKHVAEVAEGDRGVVGTLTVAGRTEVVVGEGFPDDLLPVRGREATGRGPDPAGSDHVRPSTSHSNLKEDGLTSR